VAAPLLAGSAGFGPPEAGADVGAFAPVGLAPLSFDAGAVPDAGGAADGDEALDEPLPVGPGVAGAGAEGAEVAGAEDGGVEGEVGPLPGEDAPAAGETDGAGAGGAAAGWAGAGWDAGLADVLDSPAPSALLVGR
jgi:hypothetical protein